MGAVASAAGGGRVEEPVVGEVDDERRDVSAADDQSATGRLVDAAVRRQLRPVDAAVRAPQQVPACTADTFA